MNNDSPDAGQEPAKPLELRAFLAAPEPEYDWLVPGLLERGDRLVLTGHEGKGKSTLLRQIGVQVASGIHPFTLEPIDPRRVLLVDFENTDRQLRRELSPLVAKAGRAYEERMAVQVELGGCDLLGHEADVEWLRNLCQVWEPDLLLIGPVYKMAAGDPNEERTALAVQRGLDRLRSDFGCAVALEAHSGHGALGGKRPTRPIGSSAWLRWPEFGLHLDEHGSLVHWRGARDARDWPLALKRGGAWPWTSNDRPADNLWSRIVAVIHEEKRRPSYRVLADLLGVSKTTVERAVKEHADEWDAMAVWEQGRLA